ncbi:MAG: hypothetical protein CL908_12400 [Deltaproteobacteria bacterium]|nr:hypothetical protein [Deltaproteobacteria bacterium]
MGFLPGAVLDQISLETAVGISSSPRPQDGIIIPFVGCRIRRLIRTPLDPVGTDHDIVHALTIRIGDAQISRSQLESRRQASPQDCPFGVTASREIALAWTHFVERRQCFAHQEDAETATVARLPLKHFRADSEVLQEVVETGSTRSPERPAQDANAMHAIVGFPTHPPYYRGAIEDLGQTIDHSPIPRPTLRWALAGPRAAPSHVRNRGR